MDDPMNRRIDEVRGDPLDEVRFLSHLVVDRVYDRLPPEFWQHLRTASAEVREALIVLLRAWLEYLTREAEADAAPVSRQRGKIDLVAADEPPTDTAAPSAVPNGYTQPTDFTPAPPKAVSRQRTKIDLS